MGNFDKPSGHQFREARKAAAVEAQAEEKTRREADAAYDPTAAYRTIPPPDLNDPTTALIYAQNCMLTALQEVVKDPQLPARERWKLIGFFGGQIGVTHAKALVQAKLAKVTKQLSGKADLSGGARSIRGVSKPSTSRGGASNGSDGSNGGSVPDPPTGHDGGNPPVGGGPLGSP